MATISDRCTRRKSKKDLFYTNFSALLSFRGGSWFNDPLRARAGLRGRDGPAGSSFLGFRLVLPVARHGHAPT